MLSEGHAEKLCPVDTGNLRNSITHAVADGEKAVYIGTNVEYAPYVELGTAKTPDIIGLYWRYELTSGIRKVERHYRQ